MMTMIVIIMGNILHTQTYKLNTFIVVKEIDSYILPQYSCCEIKEQAEMHIVSIEITTMSFHPP